MVQMHQITQCLLYFISFLLNANKRSTYFDILTYLSPVMVQKHQKAQFLLYLTSIVLNVFK